jgi:hypothetical protein
MRPPPKYDTGGRLPMDPADAERNQSSFGRDPRYACRACCWLGSDGLAALEHHVRTAHRIMLRAMPHWPDVRWAEHLKQGMERRIASERTDA